MPRAPPVGALKKRVLERFNPPPPPPLPPARAPACAVETIGDAFVAASCIPTYQPEHTLRIANFALEAVACANATAVDLEDPAAGFVAIRVGFHVGSIIASVVGTSRLKYTL